MLTHLRAARADGSHDRRLLRYTAPDLLIVDDLGRRPLAHDEPIDLTRSFASTTSARPPS
jgi:DNA replication protein DnaC